MLYMLTGSLSFLNIDQLTASDMEYAQAKAVSTAESICSDRRTQKFYTFVKEIYSLKFEE